MDCPHMAARQVCCAMCCRVVLQYVTWLSLLGHVILKLLYFKSIFSHYNTLTFNEFRPSSTLTRTHKLSLSLALSLSLSLSLSFAIHTHVCIFTEEILSRPHIHIYMHLYNTYLRTCTHTCRHTYTFTYTQIHMYIHQSPVAGFATYICIYIHREFFFASVHTHIHTYIQYVFAYTHT